VSPAAAEVPYPRDLIPGSGPSASAAADSVSRRNSATDSSCSQDLVLEVLSPGVLPRDLTRITSPRDYRIPGSPLWGPSELPLAASPPAGSSQSSPRAPSTTSDNDSGREASPDFEADVGRTLRRHHIPLKSLFKRRWEESVEAAGSKGKWQYSFCRDAPGNDREEPTRISLRDSVVKIERLPSGGSVASSASQNPPSTSAIAPTSVVKPLIAAARLSAPERATAAAAQALAAIRAAHNTPATTTVSLRSRRLEKKRSGGRATQDTEELQLDCDVIKEEGDDPSPPDE
jgi:hypothetical protein